MCLSFISIHSILLRSKSKWMKAHIAQRKKRGGRGVPRNAQSAATAHRKPKEIREREGTTDPHIQRSAIGKKREGGGTIAVNKIGPFFLRTMHPLEQVYVWSIWGLNLWQSWYYHPLFILYLQPLNLKWIQVPFLPCPHKNNTKCATKEHINVVQQLFGLFLLKHDYIATDPPKALIHHLIFLIHLDLYVLSVKKHAASLQCKVD